MAFHSAKATRAFYRAALVLVIAGGVLHRSVRCTAAIDEYETKPKQSATEHRARQSQRPNGHSHANDAFECTLGPTPDPRRAYVGSSTWPDGIIPYVFDANVSIDRQDAMLAAMAQWQARADVRFVPRAGHENYVYIIGGGFNASDHVGMGGGLNTVTIAGWNQPRTIMHELGHVLGFWHEIQRSDRDKYVQIHLDAIADIAEHNFEIRKNETIIGPYDFESIMHYGQCAFAECGNCNAECRSITVLPPNENMQEVIGTLPGISWNDTRAARELYGSVDCNDNGLPDDSENFADCNANNLPDECDIALQTEKDCNDNSIPDACDLVDDFSLDCDNNTRPDECDIALGASDCNVNQVPDSCDIASGSSVDCNGNNVPDECVGFTETNYEIMREDLVGVGADCGSGPYNSATLTDPEQCTLVPGISWLDTLSGGVTELEIELSVGHECHDEGIRHSMLLNGIAEVATFPATPMHCSCAPTDGVVVHRIAAPNDYVVGQRNTLLINDVVECYGFRSQPIWGTEVYGRVVVKSGELDCNENGIPDDCESEARSCQVKISAMDAEAGDYFGAAVAMSGDACIIGAPRDDWNNGNVKDTGSAYVYHLQGRKWAQLARLQREDGSPDDWYGGAVGLSGNRAVVGAFGYDSPETNRGSAWTYVFDGAAWSQEAQLLADDGTADDNFGSSVALSENVAIIGAINDDDTAPYAGSAYIYRYDGQTWLQEGKLLASDGASVDNFGSSVAISGDAAIVGAPNDGDRGPGSGSAYIYRFNGTNWSQEAKFIASDGAAWDGFGSSVGISDSVAAVGALGDDILRGSAYVFRFNGESWSEEQKLTASDGAPNDQFGAAVAMSNNALVVGARGVAANSGPDSGSAYVYLFDGASWAEELTLRALDGAAGDRFGASVAISDDTIVVGADQDDEHEVDVGAAHVFYLPGCPVSDCNANAIPDACDIECNALGCPCDILTCGESRDLNTNGIPDECEVDIPAVSRWGMLVLTLLVLTAGTLLITHSLPRPRLRKKSPPPSG